ncbi:unnamed protein product, partial [Allacma fusca]
TRIIQNHSGFGKVTVWESVGRQLLMMRSVIRWIRWTESLRRCYSTLRIVMEVVLLLPELEFQRSSVVHLGKATVNDEVSDKVEIGMMTEKLELSSSGKCVPDNEHTDKTSYLSDLRTGQQYLPLDP